MLELRKKFDRALYHACDNLGGVTPGQLSRERSVDEICEMVFVGGIGPVQAACEVLYRATEGDGSLLDGAVCVATVSFLNFHFHKAFRSDCDGEKLFELKELVDDRSPVEQLRLWADGWWT